MKNIILSLSFIVSLSVNAQIVQTEGSNTSRRFFSAKSRANRLNTLNPLDT